MHEGQSHGWRARPEDRLAVLPLACTTHLELFCSDFAFFPTDLQRENARSLGDLPLDRV